MAQTPNRVIAEALDELGDLYELDGAVIHRVVAYRNAAKAVRDSPVSIAELALAGRVTELAGIGATLEQKILDLIQTGRIPAAQRLRERFPPGVLELVALPGLGPKRARRLFDELGIDSLASLAEAARSERLRGVRGFGEKFEQSVLAAIAAGADGTRQRRVPLDRALAIGELIVAELRERCADPSARIELAGSVRRRAESVKDLDIVIGTTDPEAVLDALGELEAIESAQRTSQTAARGLTHTGMVVELRAVAADQFGNLLQHMTGSGQHNAALRERAVRSGLHVSEYGVLDDATGETHRCPTEAEVYGLLGLAYIEPELRENRDELSQAAAGAFPRLVEQTDIRGDLHCHTIASDGRETILEMGRAAAARGYEYLAITDHSATHGFGNDVSPDELRRQIERIHEADAKLPEIRLLAGTEVNILPDGSPDYDDDLLAELDWVIASVHTSFGMDGETMTARIVAATGHPLIDAIGHPTGRMIGRREPYAVDIDALIAAAAASGTLLEINSNPNRRDLSEVHARAAAHGGAGILINSDAHSSAGFDVLRYGIWTARRAGLQPAAVLNTLRWDKLVSRLKRPR
jgi:DNA polymerase (family 10)